MKIALSVVVALFLVACSEDKAISQKKEVATPTEKIAQETQTVESKVKTVVQDSSKAVEKEIEQAKTNVVKTVEPVKSVTAVKVNGAAVFKVCASCHGANAEKKAMNKSQVIKGWESAKTIAAINGYKDGTYGSTMKGVMKAQVSRLSDAEIKAVAKYISNL
jgi:cytochrome c553